MSAIADRMIAGVKSSQLTQKKERIIWFVFKSPFKIGAQPIRQFNYEPMGVIIEQLAIKHGPIVVKSSDELAKEHLKK